MIKKTRNKVLEEDDEDVRNIETLISDHSSNNSRYVQINRALQLLFSRVTITKYVSHVLQI